MVQTPKLPEQRLRLIYEGEGLGGEKTMRAKVIRELIDEIRELREELQQAASTPPPARGQRSNAPASGSMGESVKM